MNYIVIKPNPWLQYGTKIPISELSLSMIQATLNDFLHKNGILLHKVVYGLPDENSSFNLTTIGMKIFLVSLVVYHILR